MTKSELFVTFGYSLVIIIDYANTFFNHDESLYEISTENLMVDE